MYGGKPGGTRCSPSRYVLKKFGGDLSDDEYRDHVTSNEPHLILSMPATEMFIHTTNHTRGSGGDLADSNTHDVASVVTQNRRLAEINSVSGSQKKTESLRLKRPTPIKLDKNNIENALGLIRKPTC